MYAEKLDELSFRPLTGILFFNLRTMGDIEYFAREKFPSPYGDFVFQQATSVRHSSHDELPFPSPYGDFVFQQSLRKALSFLT